MTQTTKSTQLYPETGPDPHPLITPRAIVLNLIVTLLAPMFLGVTAGDVALARMAAQETVSTYRTRDFADLVAVAQVIAFGLAALGSLSLSMADDISPSMTLRLRGNANALNRSAERNRRAMKDSSQDTAALHQVAPEPETPAIAEGSNPPDTQVFLSTQAANVLAAEAAARLYGAEKLAVQSPNPVVFPMAASPIAKPATQAQQQETWAIAMVNEAEEITAGLPRLPVPERKAASFRAAVLSSTASQLLTG